MTTKQKDNSRIPLGILSPLRIKSVPLFVGFSAAIGPGIIWASLAQGSGELIWWPYLTAKYGAVFIGLLLPAALLQYFVNQEVVRYTITTGETFFTGMARIGKKFSISLWFMMSITFLWFGGYASGSAMALRELSARAKLFPQPVLALRIRKKIDETIETGSSLCVLIISSAFLLICSL